MSLQAWQLEAQKKFKEFKRNEKLIGEQVDLNYTVNTYEEHWDLLPIEASPDLIPQRYRLFAGRFFCKVEGPDKKITDLNKHTEQKPTTGKAWLTEQTPASPEYYTIKNCARCGGDHPVEFMPLTNPIETWERPSKGSGRILIEWFGMCPILNEPLLMNKTDNP